MSDPSGERRDDGGLNSLKLTQRRADEQIGANHTTDRISWQAEYQTTASCFSMINPKPQGFSGSHLDLMKDLTDPCSRQLSRDEIPFPRRDTSAEEQKILLQSLADQFQEGLGLISGNSERLGMGSALPHLFGQHRFI